MNGDASYTIQGKVCTLENVDFQDLARMISENSNQPIALVMLGVKSGFKTALVQDFWLAIDPAVNDPRMRLDYDTETLLKMEFHALVELDSADVAKRQKVVQRLRGLGAKTVVGVLATPRKKKIPLMIFPGATFSEARRENARSVRFNVAVDALAENLKTAEEFDCLVECKEEDCDDQNYLEWFNRQGWP